MLARRRLASASIFAEGGAGRRTGQRGPRWIRQRQGGSPSSGPATATVTMRPKGMRRRTGPKTGIRAATKSAPAPVSTVTDCGLPTTAAARSIAPAPSAANPNPRAGQPPGAGSAGQLRSTSSQNP